MSRIIAGAAGGHPLRSVPGQGTRPTTDRTKEAVFSWLSTRDWLDGTAVADLFAGSGALGLEALSRGAASVVLVERDRRAAGVCSANAQAVGRALGVPAPRVHARAVDTVLMEVLDRIGQAPQSSDGPSMDAAQAAPEGPWHLVLADPPYPLAGQELRRTLELIAACLVPDGLLVLERSARSAEPDWPTGAHALETVDARVYGETTVYYAQRVSDAP